MDPQGSTGTGWKGPSGPTEEGEGQDPRAVKAYSKKEVEKQAAVPSLIAVYELEKGENGCLANKQNLDKIFLQNWKREYSSREYIGFPK